MPTANSNPYRSVALLLISLTIIVLGVAYNQVASKVEVGAATPPSSSFGIQTKTTTTQPTSNQPATTTQQPQTNTTPQPGTTITPTPTPSTSIINFPSIGFDQITPGQLEIVFTMDLTEAIMALAGSLDNLRQFINLPNTTVFAGANLDVNLPGIGQAPPTPTTETTTLPPTAPTPSVLEQLSGYTQWQSFKTNFRAAQQKYAGTGQCMINISGFGCLVTW